MADELQKPTKRWHVYAYDYSECRDYLQARDGYVETDYAGRFHGNEDAPYQNFFHFVLDTNPDIRNGSTFLMHEGWKENAVQWQVDILMKYLTTFGERDVHGALSVEFYVTW